MDSYTQSYVWANNLPGWLWASECKELAVDPSGNVLVTGFIEDSVDFDPGVAYSWMYAAEPSPFIAKYSPDGDFKWARVFPCDFRGLGEDVEVDEDGNVYVLGHYSTEIEFSPGAITPYGGAFIFTDTLEKGHYIVVNQNVIDLVCETMGG